MNVIVCTLEFLINEVLRLLILSIFSTGATYLYSYLEGGYSKSSIISTDMLSQILFEM